jgi:hypothetical protein
MPAVEISKVKTEADLDRVRKALRAVVDEAPAYGPAVDVDDPATHTAIKDALMNSADAKGTEYKVHTHETGVRLLLDPDDKPIPNIKAVVRKGNGETQSIDVDAWGRFRMRGWGLLFDRLSTRASVLDTRSLKQTSLVPRCWRN